MLSQSNISGAYVALNAHHATHHNLSSKPVSVQFMGHYLTFRPFARTVVM